MATFNFMVTAPFFDFLPFGIGPISGFNFKIQIYNVASPIKYNITHKLVLRGMDGIV